LPDGHLQALGLALAGEGGRRVADGAVRVHPDDAFPRFGIIISGIHRLALVLARLDDLGSCGKDTTKSQPSDTEKADMRRVVMALGHAQAASRVLPRIRGKRRNNARGGKETAEVMWEERQPEIGNTHAARG
jgi:hypothetical protein